MGDCPNFNCDKQTWGTNIRCSKCRHSRTYTCTSCGDNMMTPRTIRCKTCSRINHNDIIYKRQRVVRSVKL